MFFNGKEIQEDIKKLQEATTQTLMLLNEVSFRIEKIESNQQSLSKEIDALKPDKQINKKPKSTNSIKTHVVSSYLNGKSVKSLAKKHKVAANTIYRWIKEIQDK